MKHSGKSARSVRATADVSEFFRAGGESERQSDRQLATLLWQTPQETRWFMVPFQTPRHRCFFGHHEMIRVFCLKEKS